MASSKRHHFIPQHYLRNFADDSEGLYQLEKCNQPKPIGTRVVKAGFQTNFHTIEHADKEPDRESIERELSKTEGVHSQNIRKILSTKTCSHLEKENLADFVALTYYRTPFQKAAIEDLLRASVEVTYRMMEEKGMFPPPTDELRKHMVAGKMPLPKIKIKNWKLLEMIFQAYATGPILQILQGMKSVVLFSDPDSKNRLITSDNPIVLFDRDYNLESPYGCGFETPTIEVSVPLSENALAVFRHDESFPRALDEKTVARYNNRMVVSTSRFLYLREPTKEILSSVRRFHKQSLSSPTEKLEKNEDVFIKTKQIPVCNAHFDCIKNEGGF